MLSCFSGCALAGDVESRIAFIQNELNYGSHYSRLWQMGWVSGTVVATAKSAYEYENSDDPNKRYDGLIYSTLGLVSLQDSFSAPLLTHRYANKLSRMPQNSAGEALLKLAKAEEMMTRAAQREKEERSHESRLRTLSLNLIASLLIAYDDHRPKQAVVNFMLYSLASEAKTYTTPTTMSFAKQRYDAGHYMTPPSHRPLSFKERFSLSLPKGRQLQMEIKF